MNDATLAARLARLERAARRDRAIALGAIAVFLATAQAPAPSAPIVVGAASGAGARIDATGLSVRDATGKVRTLVGLDDGGRPSADLYDATGTLRQTASLLQGTPTLRQFDKSGKRRDDLFLASDNQNPEFALHDERETTRLAVFRGSQGLPEFAVYGSDGAVRAYLSTDDDIPYLVMKDGTQQTRLVIGAYTSGKVGLDVRNTAGTAIWSKP